MLRQEPAAWRMMVNIGVDPRVIPAGMGPEVVVIDEARAGRPAGPSLWISRPGAQTFGSDGRHGADVLSVTVHQTARGIAPGVRSVQNTVEQTMERLRESLCLPEDVFRVEELGTPIPPGHQVGPKQEYFPSVDRGES